MSSPKHQASEYPPRLHNDVYPFIYPKKYKATLHNKVTVITDYFHTHLSAFSLTQTLHM
jgi:hypothetical protein